MTHSLGKFPDYRPRRMRRSEALRRLVRETRLSRDQLIMPYFITEGRGTRQPIDSMPGQFRYSGDAFLGEAESLLEAGVRAVLVFCVPAEAPKDEHGAGAAEDAGLVQRTVREVKGRFPELTVITDVCLCAYTRHGHCGVLTEEGAVDNDATLNILKEVALSHARAGADMVAPSDMMDGRVGVIRKELDHRGFKDTAILSYAAKYASAFYGPFREAAHSAPAFGDRRGYQMDPANREEAMREIALDIEEGADMIMVKPALAYLDVLREARERFRFPLAAYAVSGEYAMIKAAAERGLIDERKVVMETMLAYVRAGAQAVISYHAKEAAGWLGDPQLDTYQGITAL